MELIDLHVHSTISDGTLSPSQLVHYAKEKHLKAFALTDHDTTAGLKEALEAGRQLGIEVITGIELSANHHGTEVHILGYGINPEASSLNAKLDGFLKHRAQRNAQMLALLAQLGCPLSEEDLAQASGIDNTAFTRAHFATALYNKGYITSLNEAFTKYIGKDKPAYVPKLQFSVKECIELIHEAKGLAVLAHPMLYGYNKPEITALIGVFKKMGLDGVECLYSTHKLPDTNHLLQVCKNYKLLPTGGSDFHGERKPGLDLSSGYGNLQVPYSLLKALKEQLEKYK